MTAAKLSNSQRLQRVLAVLSDMNEHSTREIAAEADVCAVNSCITELRENGAVIDCRQTRHPATENRIWLYKMTSPPPVAATE